MKASSSLIFCISLLPLAVSSAYAASYVESVNGDLSTLPGAPTFISLDLGTNTVSGTVQASTDTRDYFSFTILPSQTLTGIFLLSYTDVNAGTTGNRGFIHIDDGLSSILPVSGTALLGGNHLDRSVYPLATTNVLANLATAPLAGSGFTAPLGSGSYTINVQQTGPQLTAYSLSLVVVPEPSVAVLMLVGLCSAVGIRRRK